VEWCFDDCGVWRWLGFEPASWGLGRGLEIENVQLMLQLVRMWGVLVSYNCIQKG